MAKYRQFPQIPIQNRQWPDKVLQQAPVWCSVDLRDGNQALPVPMTLDQKLEFFALLVKIGFKEIEVGFPAANDTEYAFIRTLIDRNLIPDDVKIQVLCPIREPLMKKTLSAVEGAKKVIFHLYNAVSPVHRQMTFGMTKEEVLSFVEKGVKTAKSLIEKTKFKDSITLEYSPEDFSGTECDFAAEVCSTVLKAWGAERTNPVILNLPTTVEHSSANIFADQVEYFVRKLSSEFDPDTFVVSLHNHNDRGTGVACAELGLLAGAQRIEGTLFGNGERTGNLDVVTVALNMLTQGIDPALNFNPILPVAAAYTRLTGMGVQPRQPYAGALVFTSFSGSHQDAIRKALSAREQAADPEAQWNIPYLPIDPEDVGRHYEEIIRINAQSGKGGTAWLLEHDYGIILPKAMHPSVGAAVTKAADKKQRELTSKEVFDIFEKGWLNTAAPLKLLDLAETHVDGSDIQDNVLCRAAVEYKGEFFAIGSRGNGPLAAFVAALAQTSVPRFSITSFHEHSVGTGSDTDAFAYVALTFENGQVHWGCGKSSNIGRAGVNAVVSAINRLN
ncbi:MAG: 2-isopropylmalate synthase [Treponemataceae bacterium]|nr:2-isopropylmalate synthase [Treponemataceae bacterium]